MKPLEDFLKPTQKELFARMRVQYKGRTKICKDKYILVKGDAPALLVAHMDTVHHVQVKDICQTKNGNILMSPQGIGGDDRCGVYALNVVYEKSAVKPWMLFTCDEEVGCVGASAFCSMYRKGTLPKELDNLKLIVEIDRKGKNDAVYYDCGNKEFEEYITSKGFKTTFGSVSDISYVAPELGVAAVNLSSGYYEAHTLHEYINRSHLNATIKAVTEIVADSAKPDFPKYEYVEDRRFIGWGRWRLHTGLTSEKETAFLKKVPEEIREEYEALLDFYSIEELEEYRMDYGDRSIAMLFESDFGVSFCLSEEETEDDGGDVEVSERGNNK